MQATVNNPYAAWLIIGCAAMVLLVLFGGTVCHRLFLFNHKYHILGWDNGSLFTWEDEDE